MFESERGKGMWVAVGVVTCLRFRESGQQRTPGQGYAKSDVRAMRHGESLLLRLSVNPLAAGCWVLSWLRGRGPAILVRRDKDWPSAGVILARQLVAPAGNSRSPGYCR